MKYSIVKDIKIVLALLEITPSRLAEYLNVARSTINRIINRQINPSDTFLEIFYSFAYQNNINLNEMKIRLANEKYDPILFHGARGPFESPIDLDYSRLDIDVGKGFYLGENYKQATSYIFANKKSSVLLFNITNLSQMVIKEFDVSLEWMLMICYYRGQIDQYKNSHIIKRIIQEVESSDIVVAPIADNNMYDIMNQFARGDITDKQATASLSASHLGKQHVLKSKKACLYTQLIDTLYLCKKERDDVEQERRTAAESSFNKSKEEIRKYRHIGQYIEEILK